MGIPEGNSLLALTLKRIYLLLGLSYSREAPPAPCHLLWIWPFSSSGSELNSQRHNVQPLMQHLLQFSTYQLGGEKPKLFELVFNYIIVCGK